MVIILQIDHAPLPLAMVRVHLRLSYYCRTGCVRGNRPIRWMLVVVRRRRVGGGLGPVFRWMRQAWRRMPVCDMVTAIFR